MSKKEIILTYSLMFIIIIGAIVATFVDSISNIVSAIITSLAAIVGAVALYIQMRKDKQISQASFLLEFSKYFYIMSGAGEIEEKFDRAIERGEEYDATGDVDYEGRTAYLQWCESLASLIKRGTLSVDKIDTIFSYRFFSIVNNTYIQKEELIKFPDYYKNIFLLHKKWTEYKKRNGEPILFADKDLSKVSIYNSIISKK